MSDHHDVTAGQFAFAPATQQTTVVTTTTTTVTLPPIVLQPPHDQHRDSKRYPLAASATPATMRNLTFDLDGKTITFAEADRANLFLENYHTQQSALVHSSGTIIEGDHGTDIRHTPGRSKVPLWPIASKPSPTSKYSPRPNSIPSLAHAAELAAQERRSKRPRSLLARAHPNAEGYKTHALSKQPLATPGPESGAAFLVESSTQELDDSIGESAMSTDPVCGPSTESRRSSDEPLHLLDTGTQPPKSSGGPHKDSGNNTATTPPAVDGDGLISTFAVPRAPEERSLPSQAGLLGTFQQDASLPSPSLSPVTAAANLARSRSNARAGHARISDGNEILRLDLTDPSPSSTTSHVVASAKAPADIPRSGPDAIPSSSFLKAQSRTLMDIPEMIRTFDALPEQLQSYVGFQMLKCCSNVTLASLSNVVVQALKLDPFENLPTEVLLKITKLLDRQSLCRAAQVSHRWRLFVDSDEAAWKDLIDRDGFVVSEEEIQRAIRDGWGWYIAGLCDPNRDVHNGSRESQLGPEHFTKTTDPHNNIMRDGEPDTIMTGALTRLKRKARDHNASSKRQKSNASTALEQAAPWVNVSGNTQLVCHGPAPRHAVPDAHFGSTTTRGPLSYATAAIRAQPNTHEGLKSLRNMHFFKSIYQRHHMTRCSWFNNDFKPRHLAFQAHGRHVVTCLLFDSNRIITGSDDASIHVYDTQTGILRRKLEGHEGGVWALACEGDILVSGSTDRSVRMWDLASGKCKQIFQGHSSTVRCLVILQPSQVEAADGTLEMQPKEPIIITGSRDSTLRMWKLPSLDAPMVYQEGVSQVQNERDNPYAIRTLAGHHNSVRAIAAHGDMLVSGSYDNTVRLWKTSTGELVHRLTGHTNKVYSVVLDHERKQCISGSMDNLVKVWSLTSGVCLLNLEGHTSLVGLLDLSHGYLVSAAADSTLRIWEPQNVHCRSILSAHTGAITCFQHDASKVISGSVRTLKMWDIATGECIRDLLTGLSGVWQVKFDQRRCVAAVQRGVKRGTETENLTYIEVLDFGASRDGVLASDLGRRIVVDSLGHEVHEAEVTPAGAGAAMGPVAAQSVNGMEDAAGMA